MIVVDSAGPERGGQRQQAATGGAAGRGTDVGGGGRAGGLDADRGVGPRRHRRAGRVSPPARPGHQLGVGTPPGAAAAPPTERQFGSHELGAGATPRQVQRRR